MTPKNSSPYFPYLTGFKTVMENSEGDSMLLRLWHASVTAKGAQHKLAEKDTSRLLMQNECIPGD